MRLFLAKGNALVGTARVGWGLDLEALGVSRSLVPT